MDKPTQDIILAGKRVPPHIHVCAFFHDQDEEYQVMMPFIKEGLERGERALHIVDPKLQQDHAHRLENAGLNPAQLEKQNQLEVRVWDQAYLRTGRFDQNDMLKVIQEVLTGGRQVGFSLTRLIAHMEWSLENRPGVEDIMEYESRLNTILHQFPDPVICVYDLGKFGAGTVIDILRTHPMVIVGGIIHENPFYVPPDQFIEELHTRNQKTM